MQTVVDLGIKAKKRYPGRFDHLSDAEAGREFKRIYPGAYDRYIDVGLAISNQSGVQQYQPDRLQIRTAILNQQEFDQRLQYYWNKHDPGMGMILGWIRRRRLEGENKYSVQLKEQERHLLDQAEMLTQHVIQGIKHENELLLFLQQNAVAIEQLKYQLELIRNAAEQGLTVDQYTFIQQEHYLSLQRINEFQEMERIKIESAKKQSDNILENAQRHAMVEQEITNFIKRELEKAYIRRDNIKMLKHSEEVKKSFRKLEDKHIKNLEAQLNERYSRLVQTASRLQR
jgi:hypothetical protein